MQVRADAILWRRWNEATYDTLQGNSRGQYDIRLNKQDDLRDFFKGIPETNATPHGGFDLVVPIEPADGAYPVPAETIIVRYMGPRSERKDWYIKSQRPATAYPLWRPEIGVPDAFDATLNEYLFIMRDQDSCYHCRWVHADEIASLPAVVRMAIQSKDVGWKVIS